MAYHVAADQRRIRPYRSPTAPQGLGFAYIMPSSMTTTNKIDPAIAERIRPEVRADRAKRAEEWLWVSAVSLGLVTVGLVVAWVLSGEATGKKHMNIVTQTHE